MAPLSTVAMLKNIKLQIKIFNLVPSTKNEHFFFITLIKYICKLSWASKPSERVFQLTGSSANCMFQVKH